MKTKILIFFTALLLSINAFAISLQDAKNQGMLGEQLNGYLGVVKASPEANKLMTKVNGERRSYYQKIAKKNGITLNEVASLAAKKAISATKKGQFYQNKHGKWVRK